jgi:hypothetical protein
MSEPGNPNTSPESVVPEMPPAAEAAVEVADAAAEQGAIENPGLPIEREQLIERVEHDAREEINQVTGDISNYSDYIYKIDSSPEIKTAIIQAGDMYINGAKSAANIYVSEVREIVDLDAGSAIPESSVNAEQPAITAIEKFQPSADTIAQPEEVVAELVEDERIFEGEVVDARTETTAPQLEKVNIPDRIPQPQLQMDEAAVRAEKAAKDVGEIERLVQAVNKFNRANEAISRAAAIQRSKIDPDGSLSRVLNARRGSAATNNTSKVSAGFVRQPVRPAAEKPPVEQSEGNKTERIDIPDKPEEQYSDPDAEPTTRPESVTAHHVDGEAENTKPEGNYVDPDAEPMTRPEAVTTHHIEDEERPQNEQPEAAVIPKIEVPRETALTELSKEYLDGIRAKYEKPFTLSSALRNKVPKFFKKFHELLDRAEVDSTFEKVQQLAEELKVLEPQYEYAKKRLSDLTTEREGIIKELGKFQDHGEENLNADQLKVKALLDKRYDQLTAEYDQAVKDEQKKSQKFRETKVRYDAYEKIFKQSNERLNAKISEKLNPKIERIKSLEQLEAGINKNIQTFEAQIKTYETRKKEYESDTKRNKKSIKKLAQAIEQCKVGVESQKDRLGKIRENITLLKVGSGLTINSMPTPGSNDLLVEKMGISDQLAQVERQTIPEPPSAPKVEVVEEIVDTPAASSESATTSSAESVSAASVSPEKKSTVVKTSAEWTRSWDDFLSVNNLDNILPKIDVAPESLDRPMNMDEFKNNLAGYMQGTAAAGDPRRKDLFEKKLKEFEQHITGNSVEKKKGNSIYDKIFYVLGGKWIK